MARHLTGGLSVLAVVLAAVGCASTGHTAAPAAPAISTPTAAPTPASAATPTPSPLTATVSVTRKHPLAGTKVGVTVLTVPNARITVVAHFQASDRKKAAHADAGGEHTFWYRLGNATPGYRVRVNVHVFANGHQLARRAWFTPRQRPPPPAPAAPSPAPPSVSSPSAAPPPGCYPKTDGGNCYEPGEYCRISDHGMHGIAGNGEAIVCEDNNGWRWEPA